MLGGAYSTQFKNIERQHVDTIKTLAVNEKSDAIARARKLSVETNRRRRALAIKRKSEAEREEKRRKQILAKRREKQQEATEKFQRGHIQSRPGSGASSTSGRWSPRRTNIHTQLDDALKIIRSSPASSRTNSARTRNQPSPSSSYYRQNSDPLSKPYFNKYAHPSINNGNSTNKQEELHSKSLRNLNNSRNLFEQQLESYQQSLLEQQQKTLREFNKQVMKEIEVDKNVVNHEPNEVNGLERSESLSTVDSLEEGDTNNTVRQSVDLNVFMTQKNDGSNFANGAKNVTFSENNKDEIKIYGNNSHLGNSAVSVEPPNIDSYHAQMQGSQASNQRAEDQKQQFYLQRQKEIQLQLQEQQHKQMVQQQKQQQEQQQRALEQQQRQQQQLLQQQYERQRQEELERQQQEEKYRQQQAAVSMATTTTAGSGYGMSEEGKENQRPKAQLKAWGTPSPHPPTPASTVTSAASTYVTHTSPYTGKNTHTNTTVPMVTSNGQSSKSSIPVSAKSQPSVPQTNTVSAAQNVIDSNMQANSTLNKSEYTNPSRTVQEKSLSFLETFTSGLSVTSQSNSTTSSPITFAKNQPNASVQQAKFTPQVQKANSAGSSRPSSTANVSKPPIHAGYYNSYGAAYSARQQHTNGSNTKQTVQDKPSAVTTNDETAKTNGNVTWALPDELAGHLKMVTSEPMVNGDDPGDTDSVSTICEEREPEPKEVRSILKRTGSGKKTGGILKKSCSTGNMKEIRDSLEITRVHLQTSAEEKEQRMLRERERLKNPPPTPTKKNVRFADLNYDEQESAAEGDSKLFHKRNNDSVHHKPPRPVSAVTTKNLSPKIDSKPPRAASANNVRTSTIPRAKTQVVRPQAAAHIITQSTQLLDNPNEKVTVVNSNFMEKIPAMARANQTALSVAPASVYAVNSVNYTQPQQKGNYAVSSIVMPKTDSAPFIYPGYNNKTGPVPAGSVNGPSQGGNNVKHDGAVYDENGLRIDRTPTDDEINFLWDKLRTCLSRNSQATPDAPQNETHSASARQAAPVAHTYIDGNALGQFNSLNRVAQQPGYNNSNNPAIRRQNSLDSVPNTYTRRYGLLQQRKQQPNPNSLKSRQQQQQQQQQQGYTVYQAPIQSNSEPQATGPVVNGADISESMAGFLAAEQLAEQSVSESRIHEAMEEAQAKQFVYNSARPQPKVKSALSVEEQRLMESLDRLNDKLQTADGIVPNTTPPTQHVQQQQQQQQAPRQQLSVHRSSFLTEDGKRY